MLREIAGSSRMTVAVQETVSLEQLKRRIGIDAGVPVVASIGDRQLSSDHRFSDSDTIVLLPVVAGG